MSLRPPRCALARVALASLVLACPACGYRPATQPDTGYCVAIDGAGAADEIALRALASGVRDGLLQARAFATCPPGRRARVRLMHIAATPHAAIEDEREAIGRGTRIVVRAHVEVSGHGARRSHEAEGEAWVETGGATSAAAQVEADGRAQAARSAGLALVSVLLAPAESVPGRP